VTALLERPTVNAGTGYTLRTYQEEISQAISDMKGTEGLVILPTGLGKTVSLTRAPFDLGISSPGVTLILVHRDELVRQTVGKIKTWNPTTRVSIEQANLTSDIDSDVVVASVQSMQNGRLARFFCDRGSRVQLVICDEGHHGVAPSYKNIFRAARKANSQCKILGFTATPNREDNRGLGYIFGEALFERNLAWAVDNGYLACPAARRTTTNTSIAEVGTAGDDFAQGALAQAVDTEDRNRLIVSTYKQHCDEAKAIVFCASVGHAQNVAAMFLQAGVPSRAIFGNLDKETRREYLQDFHTGKILVLTNFSCLTEGFDDDEIDSLFIARPTKSNNLYIQMLGRALRPLDSIARQLGPNSTHEERLALIENSAKPLAKIFDIADEWGKHKVVTLTSLWSKGGRDENGNEIVPLPRAFDSEGESILNVREKYTELYLLNVEAAECSTTFQEVVTYLHMISNGEELHLPQRTLFLTNKERACQAKAAGQKTFEGTPCSKCGATTRLTSATCCVACRREHTAKWTAAHPDKHRERNAKWLAANPDKNREKNAKWRAENPDKHRERNAKWQAANPDKVREYHAKHHTKRKVARLASAAAEAAVV
jgi:superfamily II DNA or RNA helicase